MKKLILTTLMCLVAFGLKAADWEEWTSGSSLVVMKGKVKEAFDWSGADNLKDQRDVYFVTQFNAAGEPVDAFAFEVGVPYADGKKVNKADAISRMTDGNFWPADKKLDEKNRVVDMEVYGFDADGEGYSYGPSVAKTKGSEYRGANGVLVGYHWDKDGFHGGSSAKIKARYDKKATEAVTEAMQAGDDIWDRAPAALDEYLSKSKKYPGVTQVSVNWSNAGGTVNEGAAYTLTVTKGGNEEVVVGLDTCCGLFSFDPITATIPAGESSAMFTVTAGATDGDDWDYLYVDVAELANGDWIPVFGTDEITQTVADLDE